MFIATSVFIVRLLRFQIARWLAQTYLITLKLQQQSVISKQKKFNHILDQNRSKLEI